MAFRCGHLIQEFCIGFVLFEVASAVQRQLRKGNYCRYLAEFGTGKETKEVVELSLNAYQSITSKKTSFESSLAVSYPWVHSLRRRRPFCPQLVDKKEKDC